MNDEALFTELAFPDTKEKISTFEYVVIDKNDHVRVYYKVNEDVERSGFNFYVTEFNSASGEKHKSLYDDPELIVDCLFWGNVYWDGLRHMYMGDKETGNENYLYYAGTHTLATVFSKIRELELKYCDVEQLDS